MTNYADVKEERKKLEKNSPKINELVADILEQFKEKNEITGGVAEFIKIKTTTTKKVHDIWYWYINESVYRYIEYNMSREESKSLIEQLEKYCNIKFLDDGSLKLTLK